MKTTVVGLIIFSFASVLIAQSSEHQMVLELDQGWEKAQLNADVSFLEKLVAEDFIWVHNHASLIDGKLAVINRARKIQQGNPNDTRARESRDQKVIILGNTAVVSGITVVDRGPSPVTYHFMRTYVKVDGKYSLLANHTMAIPDEELKGK